MKKSNNWQGQLDETVMTQSFRIQNPNEFRAWKSLINSDSSIKVIDQIVSQIKDLVKLENPEKSLSPEEYEELISIKLLGIKPEEYGVWVYYPWNNTLIHILEEDEFIKVRTIRNAYKITLQEQKQLQSKKIGIVGLSVGQSVALTIAMERSAGEIRIADFDTLELSNLNRIRTGVHNIGLKKTTIVAREIAEIDPYLKVTCFNEGLNASNIKAFFEEGGKLDLLVEECDSVEVKILAREEAKTRKVPVIMDTSDRGMLDIERFDLNPKYPILHGLIDPKITFEFLSNLKTSEEKLPYIVPILGAENLSLRLKASALEVGKTITTWPQLGSDVALGGALCANVSRRILLKENILSGRNYIDLDKSIKASIAIKKNDLIFEKPLSDEILQDILTRYTQEDQDILTSIELENIIEAATLAPSPGNKQQWKFVYKSGILHIFIDKNSSQAFGDNLDIASTIAIGCALENIQQTCHSKSIKAKIEIIEDRAYFPLTAVVKFERLNTVSHSGNLSEYIKSRKTTRSNNCTNIDTKPFQNYMLSLSSDRFRIDLTTDKKKINAISELICKADRIRFMNIQGHQEFFQNEVRWTREESEEQGDGLDLSLFDLSPSDLTGLKLSKEAEVIEFINTIDGGKGFEKISEKTFNTASAIGYVTVKSFKTKDLIEAGTKIERMWLWATMTEIGIYPISALPMLLSFTFEDKLQFNSTKTLNELNQINSMLLTVIPEISQDKLVFMFRIASEPKVSHKSSRKTITEKIAKL